MVVIGIIGFAMDRGLEASEVLIRRWKRQAED